MKFKFLFKSWNVCLVNVVLRKLMTFLNGIPYLQSFSSVCVICSIKLITLVISIFYSCLQSVMEAISKFFVCCLLFLLFNWFGDWLANNWLFLDESCFNLYISCCRYLICLINSSSLVLFVNELDHGSSFLHLRFNMSKYKVFLFLV